MLEILGGSHAHGPRARIAYAGLHRPTDSRHKTRHLTRNRATRKSAAYNGCKLLHSVGRKRLSVRRGDLDDHLRLVQRHNGEIGAGNEYHKANTCILESRRTNRFHRKGFTHEVERLRERKTLLAKRRNHPLAHLCAKLFMVSGAHRQRFK